MADRSKLLIIPASVNYDRGLLRPAFAIAAPFVADEAATPELVMATATEGMQRADELAAHLSRRPFKVAA